MQKIPHADTVNNEQYAAVHYLCGAPHGGTAIYRYLPRNMVRIRHSDRHVVNEMIQAVHDHPEERARMEEAVRRLGKPRAAEEIVDHCYALVGKERHGPLNSLGLLSLLG